MLEFIERGHHFKALGNVTHLGTEVHANAAVHESWCALGVKTNEVQRRADLACLVVGAFSAVDQEPGKKQFGLSPARARGVGPAHDGRWQVFNSKNSDLPRGPVFVNIRFNSS